MYPVRFNFQIKTVLNLQKNSQFRQCNQGTELRKYFFLSINSTNENFG